jgi:hypothetical protein
MALVVAFEFAIAGFAVILSAAKNPEELNTQQPLGPFNQDSLPLLYLLVIFQRSEGTHRQQHMQLN